MTKWEYKIVRTKGVGLIGYNVVVKDDGELKGKTIAEGFNILGAAGWELVTTGMPVNVSSSMPQFVFKRPLG